MSSVNTKKRKSTVLEDPDVLQIILDRNDIWEDSIFPFVGVGEFAFVAPVHRNLKDSYKAFVSKVQKPPCVKIDHIARQPRQVCHRRRIDSVARQSRRATGSRVEVNQNSRQATGTDTFYSAAFATVSRAEFWESDKTKGEDRTYPDLVCTEAAKIGSVKVLEWARDKGFPWNVQTCAMAAKNGHLDVLKYAHQNGCPWNAETCSEAAKNGHLDVLKWACENGCSWNGLTCAGAAKNGHLSILKWAHENGCPWGYLGTCFVAANNGHLHVLKWAHENGCPWAESTCTGAARNGHLDVLKYAHDNGCPWSTGTYRAAVKHQDVLLYLREQGCPGTSGEEEESD